jgi:hypothetical protein
MLAGLSAQRCASMIAAVSAMVHPHLTSRHGGVAKLLRHELVVPRFAHAEGVHRVGLHVCHHLRGGHRDQVDILVRIDAARRQPVADPHVVRAAREGHGHGDLLAGAFALLDHAFHLAGVEIGLGGEIFLGNRDRLTVDVEAGENAHRRLLGVYAQRHEIGHGREDMSTIDAATVAAEHQIVAGRRPAGLLGDDDIGHAVLGKKAKFLGDDERGGVGERDEPKLGALDLWASTGGKDATRECLLHGAGKRHSTRCLEQPAAAQAVLIVCVVH